MCILFYLGLNVFVQEQSTYLIDKFQFLFHMS